MINIMGEVALWALFISFAVFPWVFLVIGAYGEWTRVSAKR